MRAWQKPIASVVSRDVDAKDVDGEPPSSSSLGYKKGKKYSIIHEAKFKKSGRGFHKRRLKSDILGAVHEPQSTFILKRKTSIRKNS